MKDIAEEKKTYKCVCLYFPVKILAVTDSLFKKNPSHYPQGSDILQEMTSSAVIGFIWIQNFRPKLNGIHNTQIPSNRVSLLHIYNLDEKLNCGMNNSQVLY